MKTTLLVVVALIAMPTLLFADEWSFLEDGSAYGSAKAGVARKLGYLPVDYDRNPEKYNLMAVNPGEYERQERLKQEVTRKQQQEKRQREMEDKLDRIDRRLRNGY